MDKHIYLSLVSLGAALCCGIIPHSHHSFEVSAAYTHLSDLGSYTSVSFDQNLRIYNLAVSHENVDFVQWSNADVDQTINVDQGTSVFYYISNVSLSWSADIATCTGFSMYIQYDSRGTGWWNNVINNLTTFPSPLIACLNRNAILMNGQVSGYNNTTNWIGATPYYAPSGISNLYTQRKPVYTYSGNLSTTYTAIASALSYWASSNIPSIYEGAYPNAYNAGFDDGEEAGYDSAYLAGKSDGYSIGYNDGRTSVSDEATSIITLFGAVANVPISVLNGLGQFVVWDVSIISILATFLVIAMFAWVIRKVI